MLNKNITFQKLQNKNPKIYSNCREGPKQCWKVFGCWKQWRRVSSTRPRHWRRVSPRAAAKFHTTQGSLTTSSPLPLVVTCKEKSKHKKPVDFSYFPITVVATQFLTHVFDIFSKKSKNREKQRKSKKYVFLIYFRHF